MQSRFIALFFVVAMLVAMGCGEPGSPQPPSLNLPAPIRDLAARRTGDVVHLTWTSSNKTTDHTTPAGQVIIRICRVQGDAPNAPCDRVADERHPLGKAATYDDILPVNLTSGPPELLTYYVELVNRAQKSAGRSNPAFTADGPAPPTLTGLTASVRSEGVVLHWEAAGGTCVGCRVRIERVTESVAPAKKPLSTPGFLAPATPSPNQLLEVAGKKNSETPFETPLMPASTTPSTTIDETAQFGQSYEYSVQAITTLAISGQTITLLGQPSSPVTIQTRDTFPPAIPKDLAAVADEQSKAIDLSWSADTEPDLAGYYVYRQTPVGQGREAPVRISGPAPLLTPSFHDPDVKPGLIYAYTVSAVDQTGNESAVSAEADESLTVPQK